MDDLVAALRGGTQPRGVRNVARDELDVPVRERAGPRGRVDERPHVAPARPELVDDARPDEPRGARDEDHGAKFCQYRLAVGPFWPWYFEPRPPLP